MTTVVMVLAQGPDDPDGNLDDRLTLDVRLTAQGYLDGATWKAGNMPWLTNRQRADRPRRDGELVKLQDGWAIRNLENVDDPLLAIKTGLMRPGEIVRVTKLNGRELVYRIVAVQAV